MPLPSLNSIFYCFISRVYKNQMNIAPISCLLFCFAMIDEAKNHLHLFNYRHKIHRFIIIECENCSEGLTIIMILSKNLWWFCFFFIVLIFQTFLCLSRNTLFSMPLKQFIQFFSIRSKQHCFLFYHPVSFFVLLDSPKRIQIHQPLRNEGT